MNDEVKLPIETYREGNQITKVCVEDVHRMVNRIQEGMNRTFNKTVDVMDSLEDLEYGKDSAVIMGKGISQPCLTDAFDEEIGSNIAFMKMKLNINIKKHKFLSRALKAWLSMIPVFEEEFMRVEPKIHMDLEGIRRHNPNYLMDPEKIEEKLGIMYRIDQENDEKEPVQES